MLKIFLTFTFLLLLINATHAAHTTVSIIENQTVDFQDFALNIDANNYQAGSASFLTITFQGSINSSALENTSNIIIDGNDYGTFNNTSTEVYNVVAWTDNSYLMSVDFFINSQSTANYLSDGRVNVDINFNDSSYANDNGVSWASSPYAAANFTYNQSTVVPVPAAAWLFGSAVLALAVIRREKNE